MSSNIKVLQVIPKLGYGGAETGCYDIAHYLPENGCESFIVTSGGELTKFVDKKKVRLIKLPVHSKNPLLILINTILLIGIILFFKISIVHARSRAPAWSCLLATKITRRKFVTTFHGTYNFNGKFKKLLTNKLSFIFGYFFFDFLMTVSEMSVPYTLNFFKYSSYEICGNPQPISNVMDFFDDLTC